MHATRTIMALAVLFALPAAATAQSYRVDAAGGVPLRKGPSVTQEVLRVAPQGSMLLASGEEQGDWSRVSFDGMSGWVQREEVREVVPFQELAEQAARDAAQTEASDTAQTCVADKALLQAARDRAARLAAKLAAARKKARKLAAAKRKLSKRLAAAKKKKKKKKQKQGSLQASAPRSSGHRPPHVIPVPGFPKGKMIPGAARALSRMLRAARADGIRLGFSDTFRNPDVQQHAYEVFKRTGRNLAGNKVPNILPGYGPRASNHTKGRAVDLTEPGGSIRKGSRAHRWLQRNARKFGFTPISIEAWHWEWLR